MNPKALTCRLSTLKRDPSKNRQKITEIELQLTTYYEKQKQAREQRDKLREEQYKYHYDHSKNSGFPDSGLPEYHLSIDVDDEEISPTAARLSDYFRWMRTPFFTSVYPRPFRKLK
jgi:hypothetical protein